MCATIAGTEIGDSVLVVNQGTIRLATVVKVLNKRVRVRWDNSRRTCERDVTPTVDVKFWYERPNDRSISVQAFRFEHLRDLRNQRLMSRRVAEILGTRMGYHVSGTAGTNKGMQRTRSTERFWVDLDRPALRLGPAPEFFEDDPQVVTL